MSPDAFTRYGYWQSRKEWLDFAEKSMREFHRTLKRNGTLYYKLTETRDRRMKILDLLRTQLFKIVKDRTTKSNGVYKNNIVHWLTMKKSEEA